jgi:DNA replication and repair protein RecF
VILKRVGLTNFRNWRQGAVEFARGVNVLWGANGDGKTNLLESVVLACAGRGIRAGADSEMITWGEQEGSVRVLLESRLRGTLDIRLRLGASGRVLTVNATPRNFSALIGMVGLVYFCPEDVSIAKGEPADRRRFLDVEIGALSRPYYFNLIRYRRVLEQRNRALKDLRDGRGNERALAAWDEPLAASGASVMRRRKRFLDDLAEPADQASVRLCGCRLSLEYEPALGMLPEDENQVREAFLSALSAGRAEDISRGLTTLGPHRDDFAILGGSVDVRKFGSEGEQRTAAVALRLGLLKVIEAALEEPPLLLLDDVMSELDQTRRQGLTEAISQAEQVIVTCTDVPMLPQGLANSARLVRIEAGRAAGQAVTESAAR